MNQSNYKISIIVPLYNESCGFEQLIFRLNKVVSDIGMDIEIVLVDDGSKDDTAIKMQAYALENKNYNCIFLSKNFGHQIAVSAGIKNARAKEALFIIDGDLQDPPELLSKFYNLFLQGNDVVYAVRKKRKEGFIKRFAYKSFYLFLKKIATIDIPLDSGDFSLISRRVANIINQMPEESRYLRGMRTWIGFNQIGYEYDREARYSGNSKYTIKKLWSLAKNGIFNFSEAPIKLMKRIGYLTLLLSTCYFLRILYLNIVYNSVPKGFTTLLFAIMLFSGLQFIFLGLIGEYILRIFFQVKQRPIYLIKNQIVDGSIKTLTYVEENKKN